MNILILIRFFSPDVGGSEFLFCTIAEILAKNGHNVWIITNKLEGVKYIEHSKIHIVFVSSYNLDVLKNWKQKYKIKYLFSAIKEGKKIIKNEKIDLIHSNPFEPIVAGSILSSLTRKPHIITIHDTTPVNKKLLEQWVAEGNSQWKARIGTRFFKFIFKLKHVAIHTVSEKTSNDLKIFEKKKPIFVIPNAIEIPKEIKRDIIPRQFVYVGRLVQHKNLPIAIKAINIVKESFPDVKLIIAGNGDQLANLEKLVSELDLKQNVIFKGHVTDEEKQTLLSSSLALIFPSLYEGFGLVILEAFAQKKPALVSNVKPLSEIVDDKKTGILIQKNNETEWANAMTYLLKNLDVAEKMGMEARNQMERRYSITTFHEKIMAMYSEFVRR